MTCTYPFPSQARSVSAFRLLHPLNLVNLLFRLLRLQMVHRPLVVIWVILSCWVQQASQVLLLMRMAKSLPGLLNPGMEAMVPTAVRILGRPRREGLLVILDVVVRRLLWASLPWVASCGVLCLTHALSKTLACKKRLWAGSVTTSRPWLG
jgi:hypothetical protein